MNRDNLNIIQSNAGLVADMRNMIGQTRSGVTRAVSAGMTFLYWRIGKRIQMEVLQYERAEYGRGILATLSQELSAEFGRGYSYSALTRMVKFAEAFPDEEIVAALRRQLGWTHFKALIPIRDPLRRDFYAEMCRVERWSIRTLASKLDSMLHERTAISKKPSCGNLRTSSSNSALLSREGRASPTAIFPELRRTNHPTIIRFPGWNRPANRWNGQKLSGLVSSTIGNASSAERQ